MNQEDKIRMSNELTKIHKKFRELGAKQEDLDIFNKLICEIEDNNEKPKTLGELF